MQSTTVLHSDNTSTIILQKNINDLKVKVTDVMKAIDRWFGTNGMAKKLT